MAVNSTIQNSWIVVCARVCLSIITSGYKVCKGLGFNISYNITVLYTYCVLCMYCAVYCYIVYCMCALHVYCVVYCTVYYECIVLCILWCIVLCIVNCAVYCFAYCTLSPVGRVLMEVESSIPLTDVTNKLISLPLC